MVTQNNYTSTKQHDQNRQDIVKRSLDKTTYHIFKTNELKSKKLPIITAVKTWLLLRKRKDRKRTICVTDDDDISYWWSQLRNNK